MCIWQNQNHASENYVTGRRRGECTVGNREVLKISMIQLGNLNKCPNSEQCTWCKLIFWLYSLFITPHGSALLYGGPLRLPTSLMFSEEKLLRSEELRMSLLLSQENSRGTRQTIFGRFTDCLLWVIFSLAGSKVGRVGNCANEF